MNALVDRKVLGVVGPTASGKTKLALHLAELFSGEIVSLDSVQWYREATIGSAKPASDELARIPHHGIDVGDPRHRSTVAEVVAHARSSVESIVRRGATPIVVGASGMYVTAFFHGLSRQPPADLAYRAACEQEPLSALYERLKVVDPDSAAKISPGDERRIVRALETFDLTGVTASQFRAEHRHQEQFVDALLFSLQWDPATLRQRIFARATEMVSAGLLDEINHLLLTYGDQCPVLEAIGYREGVAMLRSTVSKPLLVAQIAQNTARLAKQQRTYWRQEPPKRGWKIEPTTLLSTEAVVARAARYLDDQSEPGIVVVPVRGGALEI